MMKALTFSLLSLDLPRFYIHQVLGNICCVLSVIAAGTLESTTETLPKVMCDYN